MVEQRILNNAEHPSDVTKEIATLLPKILQYLQHNRRIIAPSPCDYNFRLIQGLLAGKLRFLCPGEMTKKKRNPCNDSFACAQLPRRRTKDRGV